MSDLAKRLANQLAASGFDPQVHALLAAPEYGGDFKSDGLSVRNGMFAADLGKYSTNHGENYYGYAGVQPFNVGPVKFGAALGAYGRPSSVNPIAGLLASTPIKDGEARLLLSPGSGGPSVFLGYDKPF